MSNNKNNTMKKIVQISTTLALVAFFTLGNLYAQQEATYIEEAPEDSSHMEQAINLGEEEAPAAQGPNYLVIGAIAVAVVAGAAIVIARKKKK